MPDNKPEKTGLIHKLLKDSSVLLFAEDLSEALLLGQMLLMARLMGNERFGAYAIIRAFTQTINYLLNIRTRDLQFHYFAAFRAQDNKNDIIATMLQGRKTDHIHCLYS